MQTLTDHGKKPARKVLPHPVCLLVGICAFVLPPAPAFALSELQEAPPAAPSESIEQLPLPAPIQIPASDPEPVEPEASDKLRPNVDAGQATPEVSYDLEQLPEPVQRMRKLIVEACLSGDLEALRPLTGTGNDGTRLSLGGPEDDPITFLREVSGDEEGQEILAILLEVLQAGYVHLDAGTPSELYVWPYFFAMPLDALDKRQRVELFTLVTAGDYKEMKNFGAYIFYRVGITPEGRWAFFVAGD